MTTPRFDLRFDSNSNRSSRFDSNENFRFAGPYCKSIITTAKNNRIFTDADGSHVSKATIHVCVCVCLFVCTIIPKRLKLQSPNLAQRLSITLTSLVHPLILGQKVKGRGHRIKRCKKSDRVAGITYALCRVPSP